MKKFFSLLAISFTLIAGFTACGEEDATYTPKVSSIQILKSKVSFDALGGEGTIVYSSNNKVTISCDADWVALSEPTTGTIQVQVEKNYNNIQSRNAVITLADGQGEEEIVVIQLGITKDYTFNLYDKGAVSEATIEGETLSVMNLPSDKGAAYAFAYKANDSLAIKTCSEWISLQVDEDSIYVSVDDNTDGMLRQGLIIYEVGAMRSEIIVSQYDLEADVYGDAVLYFKGIATDKETGKQSIYVDEIPVQLTSKGIVFPGTGEEYAVDYKDWTLPLVTAGNSLIFNVPNLSYIGNNGANDAYAVAIDGNLKSTFDKVSMSCTPYYANLKRVGKTTEEEVLIMDLSFGADYYGFSFCAVKSGKPMNKTNMRGEISPYRFLVPYLILKTK